MGFSATQIGERTGKNQLVMSNPDMTGFATTVAEEPFQDELKKNYAL